MTYKKSRTADFTLPLTTLLLVATTAVSYAHPGHDMTESGASHIATSPYHLIVAGMFLLVGVGLASALWVSRKRDKKAARHHS